MRVNEKIAILTQPLGKNYGGIIQNFALQYVLKKNGYIVETISREYERGFNLKKLLSIIKNRTYNKILSIDRREFSDYEMNYITSEMNSFINKYISVSNKIYTTNDLKNYFDRNKFSHVIVGSDQTWRLGMSPNIYNYYLDFLKDNNKIKKLAYASSFGINNWEYNKNQTKICKNLIKSFDQISVREDSGVILCKEYLNTNAELVLDPTLLLDRGVYESLFQHINKVHKGLFNYVLDNDLYKQEFINNLSNKLKIKIYNNQPKLAINSNIKSISLDDYKYPSIEGWLKSFHDADFIVTDSFHGTVFSIIFNKPFLAIVNEGRGASRFYSLLKLFNLEERLVIDYNKFDENLLNKSIDYNLVNKKLNSLKISSLDFLLSNI